MQGENGGPSDQMDRADPPAPPGFRARSAASPRISGHRLKARAHGGAANHGPGSRSRLSLERKARRTRSARRGEECPCRPLTWWQSVMASFRACHRTRFLWPTFLIGRRGISPTAFKELVDPAAKIEEKKK